MQSWEHVHWFFTPTCNLNCDYCHRSDEGTNLPSLKLESLARLLTKNNVKKVTLGGGEPTLVKGIDTVAKILKESGAHVSIDSHGLFLTEKKLASLSGCVDDIGLSLDTTNRKMQLRFRGNAFAPAFDNFSSITDQIKKAGIKFGVHTVYNKLNNNAMPQVYDFLNQLDFSYWTVFEFNNELAERRAHASKKSDEEKIRWLAEIQAMRGSGTAAKGYTDCIYADFLRAEAEMTLFKDHRIKFVGHHDPNRLPYTFLDNTGNIETYAWYSGNRRRVVGNLWKEPKFISDRLPAIHEKLSQPFEQDEQDPRYQGIFEEWQEAVQATPVWTRFSDGFYDEELEITPIKRKHEPEFFRLVKMYDRRRDLLERQMA